jgi:sugar lactone lactonase YvrE
MKKYSFFAAFLAAFVLTFSVFARAGEPAIWSVNTRAEVLKGDARGVSINENGTITLAPRLSEIFNTEQSYVWSSAVDASGNVFLGTGGDGKIFRVDANGRGALFYDTNELNVAAIAVGARGEIYAGTAPDGKVYRIEANGTASIFFDPKEKYIWSLAVLNDGSVAVGTGENGRIYRVRTANATPESSLLFDTSETHIISLAADRAGNLYAGTDASALVLRFGTDGKPFALLDSPLREIHDLSIAADGSVYALALGESASTAAKPADAATTPATPESATVTVEKPNPMVPETPAKSRYDLTGAKSAVYRILPDGGNDVLWSSTTVTGFSVHVNQTGNGVFLGTSDKGRVYGIGNDGRETLVLQSDESQISTLTAVGQNFYATSSNQGKLFRFGTETVAEGSYESAVLDAKSVAAWGRIWWRSAGNVQIQTRSGNTEKPNETWSAWSAALTDAKGAQIASPKAKYLQWRTVLRGSATAANLSEVNVSFLARNIAPEVLSIQILPPSVGLAANPPVQIDPNIELSGLDPQIFGIPNVAVAPRRLYQRAATSLQWTAEDRNGDRMEYAVFYREAGETSFKLLRDNLIDNFLTIDGQTLADGRYIFRVTARDSLSNPENLALSGERTSEPVDVDNTAPIVSPVGSPQINGERARVVFEATDASSFLTRAEYSVNGGEWQTVYADDSISDSPRERFTIEVPLQATGEYAVTLRVFDVNGNAGNSRILIKR